jgi:hypothetical protein
VLRAALALSGVALAGCAADPSLECDAHGGSEGLWCRAHKDLVTRFVRSTNDVEGRRARLQWFRASFYPKIARLESEDAITQAVVSLEKEMPTFFRLYQQEHLWASRDTGEMNPDRRVPLLKAGFRHAVAELERELHPRRD